MSISIIEGAICLLCAKVVSNSDFRRKLTTSGGRKKTKTCFNLESIPEKEISSDCFLTNILCRNCADKNETLVRKLHRVRTKDCDRPTQTLLVSCNSDAF